MIGITPSLPIYLYAHPTDMRKSFSGLCGIVINVMNRRPENGHLYVFINKRRNRMKLLLWDRHGFWLFYKMLERGEFQLPVGYSDKSAYSLAYEQLMMIIEGIDMSTVKRKKRYCLLTNHMA
jgi:transposase